MSEAIILRNQIIRQQTTLHTEVITSNTNWVVPDTLANNTVYVRLFGGGGGGSSNGGGGGGWMNNGDITINPGQRVRVTIGGGGSRAYGFSGDGRSGGSTSFGSYLSANGGTGGSRFGSGGSGGSGGGGYNNGGMGYQFGGGGGINGGSCIGQWGGGGGGGYNNYTREVEEVVSVFRYSKDFGGLRSYANFYVTFNGLAPKNSSSEGFDDSYSYKTGNIIRNNRIINGLSGWSVNQGNAGRDGTDTRSINDSFIFPNSTIIGLSGRGWGYNGGGGYGGNGGNASINIIQNSYGDSGFAGDGTHITIEDVFTTNRPNYISSARYETDDYKMTRYIENVMSDDSITLWLYLRINEQNQRRYWAMAWGGGGGGYGGDGGNAINGISGGGGGGYGGDARGAGGGGFGSSFAGGGNISRDGQAGIAIIQYYSYD